MTADESVFTDAEVHYLSEFRRDGSRPWVVTAPRTSRRSGRATTGKVVLVPAGVSR